MLLSAFASLVAGPLLSISAWYGSCSSLPSDDCSASFMPTASHARLRLRLQRIVLCWRDVTHNHHVHSYICEDILSNNCSALACLQPYAHTCACCRAGMPLLDPRVNGYHTPQAQDASAVKYIMNCLELLMPRPFTAELRKACCISSFASTSIPHVWMNVDDCTPAPEPSRKDGVVPFAQEEPHNDASYCQYGNDAADDRSNHGDELTMEWELCERATAICMTHTSLKTSFLFVLLFPEMSTSNDWHEVAPQNSAKKSGYLATSP